MGKVCRSIVACVSLLTIICCSIDTEYADACDAGEGTGIGQEGHAMLQASSKVTARTVSLHANTIVPNPQCALPAGATWCQVRLVNLHPYWMAVYDIQHKPDTVSAAVCNAGFWDQNNTVDFGVPGHAIDIGANIGYFTLMLAHAGWHVTAFEPMAPNLALLNASLCQNPSLFARIKVVPFGLGPKPQLCNMVSGENNTGDGHVQCGNDLASGYSNDPSSTAYIGKYNVQSRGQFLIRRFDQLLSENGITKVDLVKIDVEGYESQVLASAPNFLSQYQPRLNKLEVWNASFGYNGTYFLSQYKMAGYRFFADPQCTFPVDADAKVILGGLWEGFACKSSR